MTTKSWDEMRGEYIDSRDIIKRLEELEEAAKDEPNDLGCTFCGEGSAPSAAFEALCEDHAEELTILRDFAEQGEHAADWLYGETFIPEDQFEDYARELAEDIGAIKGDEGWPMDYIDWPRAVEALKVDYFDVTVDGITYLAR